MFTLSPGSVVAGSRVLTGHSTVSTRRSSRAWVYTRAMSSYFASSRGLWSDRQDVVEPLRTPFTLTNRNSGVRVPLLVFPFESIMTLERMTSGKTSVYAVTRDHYLLKLKFTQTHVHEFTVLYSCISWCNHTATRAKYFIRFCSIKIDDLPEIFCYFIYFLT